MHSLPSLSCGVKLAHKIAKRASYLGKFKSLRFLDLEIWMLGLVIFVFAN